MIYLRQSTASQEIPLGPFLDDADGKTPETALTIANTDIKVWATGAATLANKNSGGATHISGGIYYAVLDATDTATIGPLTIFVAVSGALAVKVSCVVLHANVYDVLFGSIAPSTYAGGAVASVTGAVGSVTGSVGSVAAGGITASSLAADCITAAKIATGAIDADAIADGAIDAGALADGSITAAKIGTGAITSAKFAAGAIDAAAIATDAIDADAIKADAVGEIQSGLATATQLGAVEADTQDIQTRLPAALVSGRMVSDAVAVSGSTAAADAVEANIANLDAAVSTRSTYAGADTGGTTTLLARLTATRAGYLDNLSAGAVPTLAQILAGGDVDGFTLEQTLKLCLAALAGKLAGASTTAVTVRAADDSKTRITATVDADGNRSAVTLDAAG